MLFDCLHALLLLAHMHRLPLYPAGAHVAGDIRTVAMLSSPNPKAKASDQGSSSLRTFAKLSPADVIRPVRVTPNPCSKCRNQPCLAQTSRLPSNHTSLLPILNLGHASCTCTAAFGLWRTRAHGSSGLD